MRDLDLMQTLVDLVYTPTDKWDALARKAFADALAERYSRVTKDALLDPRGDKERRFQVRINASQADGNIPFAGLLGPEQERSGRYGGMSFVLFPSTEADEPALITMVVGTNGLSPDEDILGRPGHARKLQAICAWLRARGIDLTWAKHEPVRIDLHLPKSLRPGLDPWNPACKRYDEYIYAIVKPPTPRSSDNDVLMRDALTAFIDLFFDERRIDLLTAARQDAERVRRAWLAMALPSTSDEDVVSLLDRRKYVIVEGPPGTGKTELAVRMLRERYHGRGRVIQFHPGTTYESFIGGLAPQDGGAMGFTFRPTPGHLMEAIKAASANPDPYLLVIDEINRADLAKVLGEAIYLFEPGHSRSVTLAYDFPHHGRILQLPENLHVLGTMNSADRSIAVLDLAVRRRFAFVPVWPQLDVVERHAGKTMARAFHDLLLVFLEHAAGDTLALLPGHAYFLADDENADTKLRTEVIPLLREYLSQGYVAAFADEIRTWLDARVESDA
jgi:5-methylcytosine-specific restriction protein B